MKCMQVFLILVFNILGFLSSKDVNRNINDYRNFHSFNDIKSGGSNGVNEEIVQLSSYATEYRGKCQKDSDCLWLGENSFCQFGFCICKPLFRWYNGTCIKYSLLNGDCQKDMDCYDGYTWNSTKCDTKTNKCACRDGFQNRGGFECRNISEANGLCALDIDCPGGYICDIGKCKDGKRTVSNLVDTDAIEDLSNDLLQFKVAGHYGNECKSDKDCTLANTECYNLTKTCICQHGYFYKNDICEAELGVKTCVSDQECYPLQAECDKTNNLCRCRNYWLYPEDNRKCIKTITQTNWNCLSDEWCYALGPNSYCSSEKICECSIVAKLNETNYICEKVRDDVLCKTDAECAYVKPYSNCIDEQCVCDGNHVENHGQCTAVLGASCEKAEDCSAVKNAECKINRCQCQNDFVASNSSRILCLEVSGLGGSCQEDIQCRTKNQKTTCLNNVCDCQPMYKNINNTCQTAKSYQEYCTNSYQCQLETADSICRNSKCQCPMDMKFAEKKCISTASKVIQNTLMMLLMLTVGLRIHILVF